MKKNILNYSYPAFLQEFSLITGRSDYFAKPLYRQVFKKGIFSPESLNCFTKSPLILKKIKDHFNLNNLALVKKIESGKTIKLIFLTHDNLKVETVVIPMKTYYTLCISSQVGCNMKCSFCQTGVAGKTRDLTTEEIVSQLFFARLTANYPIRNIVFMGMGEPLDNIKNVLTSIEIFADDHGFNLRKNHITVSTSGPGNMLKYFIDAQPTCVIALSLNAADNLTRDHLMPINKLYPIESLIDIFKPYCDQGNILFIEYVLIKEINDSVSDANKLIILLKDLKVRINLIPLNPRTNSKMSPPSSATYENFYQVLRKNGLHVIRRKSKGDEIKAACGQLGIKKT